MTRAASILTALTMTMVTLAGCLGGDGPADAASSDEAAQVQGSPALPPSGQEPYRFDASYSQVVADGIYEQLPYEKTLLASDLDGVEIEIGVWRPNVPDGVQVPVILQASPYYGNLGEPLETRPGIMFAFIQNFVQHGYAVAGVSVRGTGDSGGCMDLMGVKEIADLDQAVTWLGEQPWSSGSVGMIGLSYDGSTPWSVASTGNAYLKTIVPISGVPDVYGLMFRNGSSESRGPFLLNLLYYVFFARVSLSTDGSVPVHYVDRSLEGAICPESWLGMGAAVYSGATGDRDPLGWWDERNRIPEVNANYQGSIMSIQGLQDWNVDPAMVVPWVDEINRTGLKTKQLLGQWGHAYPDSNCGNMNSAAHFTCRWDWADQMLDWFDSELKGLDVPTGAAVEVQDNTGRWRAEAHYPPRDAAWGTFHLAAGNQLAKESGAGGSVLLTATGLTPEFVGDDDAKNTLPGYKADFTTERFLEDTLIAGLPRLHVSVTPHGPGGHLAAHLYDVAPDGMETQIGGTQINLAFADGTENMQVVTPNQQLVAKMEFQPLDANILAGHQLRVRVWESTHEDRLPTVPASPVTLSFGGSVSSTLEIPVVDRSPDAFFVPPFPADDPWLKQVPPAA